MSMTGIRPLPVVPHGPRAFRFRLRRIGGFAALAPAAALALLSFLFLRNNTTAVRGVAGFVAATLAAPALMPFGIPLANDASRMLLGILVSVVLWFGIGVVAARRATRSPVATWRDFWREYLWLAGGIWLGVLAGLLVIEIVLGRAML
jgi:hypothetical protein